MWQEFKTSANLPQHIAIIMDGNGRYAKEKGMPRIAGHTFGVASAKETIKNCYELGIKQLSLFAFCIENWNRSEEEVNALMELFSSHLDLEADELNKNNIKVKIIGSRFAIPSSLVNKIDYIENLTKNNTGLGLNIAFNYSGKWDVIETVKRIAEDYKNNLISSQDITEDLFDAHKSLRGIPPPDLLIRTSGEMRLSNYLLWDLAYTELFFTKVYWPSFNKHDLIEAISAYFDRERRFGRETTIKEQHV